MADNPAGGGEPQNANFLDLKYHGMACAGIVAASNNTIGIRGVASNVNILPVNIVPDAAFELSGRIIQGFGTNIEIAQAISWAWRRADVLSCSWGGEVPSNDITTAIDSARTYGRNGRGCVVVFASGNNWPAATDVAYPGRLDGVITKIYPNPVSDILTVDLDNKILSQGNNLEIRLYDGTGNQLRQSMVKESTVRINVASLGNGVYFLYIYDGKSDIPEKRQIVVQH